MRSRRSGGRKGICRYTYLVRERRASVATYASRFGSLLTPISGSSTTWTLEHFTGSRAKVEIIINSVVEDAVATSRTRRKRHVNLKPAPLVTINRKDGHHRRGDLRFPMVPSVRVGGSCGGSKYRMPIWSLILKDGRVEYPRAGLLPVADCPSEAKKRLQAAHQHRVFGEQYRHESLDSLYRDVGP